MIKNPSFTRLTHIASRPIGDGHRPYIIAEISANHGGNLITMIRSIRKAAECGADAVKVQTYNADSITIQCDNEYFKISKGLWKGETLYSLYSKAGTPSSWLKDIFETGDLNNIVTFSTPFSYEDLNELKKYKPPAYKVASLELNDISFVQAVASQGRPVILSTGASNIEEVKLAYRAAAKFTKDIIVLHCVSNYPTKISDCNIERIKTLRHMLPGAVVGLSDHSAGATAAQLAIAAGASVIEKHFILDDSIDSPDKEFSLTPDKFKSFVTACHDAYNAMGTGRDVIHKEATQFKRSIFVIEDIKAGEVFSKRNIRIIRPGYGLPPEYYKSVIGRKAIEDIKRGTPLSYYAIEKG